MIELPVKWIDSMISGDLWKGDGEFDHRFMVIDFIGILNCYEDKFCE